METKLSTQLQDTGFTLFSRNKEKADLKAISEEFEAIFINQMLKQARETKLSDGLFSSDEEDQFGSLLDQERSRSLAIEMNLGIADALVRQFDKSTNR
jgi:flagellar protein FlgJ